MLISPTPTAKSVVFESQWLNVEALQVAGVSAPYYRIVESPGVICVPFAANGDFVMVRQPRPAIERYTLEFPAGAIDDGETPEDAVRREVFEETGMRLAHAASVGQVQPVPNRMHCLQTLFIGITTGDIAKHGREQNAETVLVPRKDFLSTMQRTGTDCIVAIGVIKLAELMWSMNLFEEPIAAISQKVAASKKMPESQC